MTKLTLLMFRTVFAASLVAGGGRSSEKELSAVKGIYLDRAHHPAALGMRFDIEMERPGSVRTEVPVSYEFHSGDRIWLRMDLRNTAYVYVLNRTLVGGDKGIEIVRDEDSQRPPDPALTPRLVFGPEKLSRGTARLAPRKNAMLFDENPGVEKLYVILSPKPLKLESAFRNGVLITDAGHAQAVRQLDQRLAGWSGNAQVAVPDGQGAKGVYQDNYGYCVERRSNQPLMFEVTLNHSR